MQVVGFMAGDESQPLAAAISPAGGLASMLHPPSKTSPDADQALLFTAPLADDVSALVHLLMAGHVPPSPEPRTLNPNLGLTPNAYTRNP
jgi:hypothetical protein